MSYRQTLQYVGYVRRPWLPCRRWRDVVSRFLAYSYVYRTPADSIKGPGLKEFITSRNAPPFSIRKEDQISPAPYLDRNQLSGNGRKGVHLFSVGSMASLRPDATSIVQLLVDM